MTRLMTAARLLSLGVVSVWLLAACGGGSGAISGPDSSHLVQPTPVTVGALSVTISGLPAAAGATVTVTGPGSLSQALAATQLLSNLAPGSYTISAVAVTVDGI